ncbi:MAG: heme ABC exporter ATP-binding protein CcmA [Erythrobacter sp.]
MQARLSANDLACRRGDRVLFRGLALEMGAGEALHVRGANGVGKTTLIRALAGLLTPFAGRIDRVGAVGIVDERTALDPDLPLGKALRFWQQLDMCDNALDALETLGLRQLLDVPVRYLSTGQRKRAALAQLLGQDADIWLLDEPLSGLDSGAIEIVIALIRDHCAEGGIALIASHQDIAYNGLKTLSLGDYAK